MTPQEQQLIDGLIQRIRTTEVQDKDTQAEQHIQQGLSGSPDSLYVLVQTVLVQQYGLQQAQTQIAELKRQIDTLQQQSQAAAQPQKSSSGSFLSHIFGGGDTQPTAGPSHPQAQPPYQPVNNPGYGSGGYPGGGYPPPPPPSAYPVQNYPIGGGLFGGGGGGFLSGAMQTAAGVAAGELAFRGMEDLFHGFGGGGERGFTGRGGGGETVVNNYYDEDRGNDRGNDRAYDRFSGSGDDRSDQSFYNPADDASRDDLSAGAGNNDLDDNFADTGSIDSGFDDNSSGDSGFDSGGNDFSGNDS